MLYRLALLHSYKIKLNINKPWSTYMAFVSGIAFIISVTLLSFGQTNSPKAQLVNKIALIKRYCNDFVGKFAIHHKVFFRNSLKMKVFH